MKNIIRRIRDKAGMTQEEMADVLDINHNLISYLERFQRKKVSPQILKNIHKLGYNSQKVDKIYRKEYNQNTKFQSKEEWLESLLYNYEQLKEYVEFYHSGCIEQELGNMAYDNNPMRKRKQYNSVVENSAIHFNEYNPDEKGIAETITKILNTVNDKIFNFYQARYKHKMSRKETQKKLNISRRTFYRRRKYLLEMLEDKLTK